MDHLWSPWRFSYVSRQLPVEPGGCVFCRIAADGNDRENLVVHRASLNYVVLNRYPYTSGHLMVVPYEHMSDLAYANDETTAELIALVRTATTHLRAIYRPGGLNIGMNIGECAGAGVADHIHMHVLPRWRGDVNFMTSVGETRVMVEALEDTWAKVSEAFRGT